MVTFNDVDKPPKVCMCPCCGSRDLHFNLADWEARSLEPQDRHNTAVLTETQCEDCGTAFWA